MQFLTTVPLAAFQFPFSCTIQTTTVGKTAEEIKRKIRSQLEKQQQQQQNYLRESISLASGFTFATSFRW